MKKIILISLILGLLLLWFSDILPIQVAKIVASIYIRGETTEDFQIIGADYSPAHDAYFVYFKSGDHQRNIGIYYRYFPFDVYFDSYYPG